MNVKKTEASSWTYVVGWRLCAVEEFQKLAAYLNIDLSEPITRINIDIPMEGCVKIELEKLVREKRSAKTSPKTVEENVSSEDES